jgi:beta-lactamase regulating signal transducer with metallopeptidase domain/protocatechuate 3,4-dioxygenase beta subunit
MAVEFVARAVLGVSCAVMLVWAATRALSRRTSAAFRSAAWRLTILAFWVAPVAVWMGAEHPMRRVEIRVALPAAVVERFAPVRPAQRSASEGASLPAGGASRPVAVLGPAGRSPRALGEALVQVWAVGALLGLALFVRGLLGVWLLVRSGTPPQDPALVDQVTRSARLLGLGAMPALLLSDRVDSPTVVGLLSPVLVLPGRGDADSAHLRAAIVHELAHVQRRDLPMQLLACLTRVVWWWNPLTWLAARKLSEAAEEACDDWVVALTGDRAGYAQAVAEWAHAACSPSPLTCGWRGSRLTRRVRRILAEGPRPPITLTSWQRAGLTVALLALAVTVGVVRLRGGVGAQARASLPSEGLPPPGLITGRVFLADGVTFAAGAVVHAELVNGGGMMTWPPHVDPDIAGERDLAKAPHTGGDGSFSVSVLRPNWEGHWRWYVCARLPGYARVRSEPVHLGEPATLTLSRGVTVKGRVVDHGGRPAPNVHVTAYWPSYDRGGTYPGAVAHDVTNAAGAFTLRQVAPGSYCLWATGETVAPALATDVRVSEGGAENLVMPLPAPAELHGRLVYLGSGKPVRLVSPCVWQESAGVSRWAFPDADGRFVVRGLRPGEHAVLFDKASPYPVKDGDEVVAAEFPEVVIRADRALDGDEFTLRQVTLLVTEGQVIDRTFQLAEGGTVKGIVVTPDGKPVPNATVYIGWFGRDVNARVSPPEHGSVHPLRTHNRKMMVTTSKGRFCILKAPPGACFVGAKTTDGRAGHTAFFDLPNLGTREVRITLSDSGTMQPHLVPEWVWAKYPPDPRWPGRGHR